MQDKLQPEALEAKAAADLDAWITDQLTGQAQPGSESTLDPSTIDLAAVAQDVLALAEGIQPNPDFVLHLEARLRWRMLHRPQFPLTHRSALDPQQTEDQHKKI